MESAKGQKKSQGRPRVKDIPPAPPARQRLLDSSANLFLTLRQRQALSQSEFAHKLKLSQSAVSLYESGGRLPTLEMLDHVATSCGFHLKLSIAPGPRPLSQENTPISIVT